MNFKQYDDGKEGRFFVILGNEMEAGWIQYKWLDNGNLLANGTRVYEEFKDQKLGIPLFNRLVEFAEERKTKIYPLCPFVVKTFARHPELKHLLADDYLQEQETTTNSKIRLD
jgi:predicted GNAT family acetyltransferase